MKNWHFITGLLVTLALSQLEYLFYVLVAMEDAALQVPELPFNAYAKWMYVIDAAKELALVSVIAHTALNWAGSNPWTKAIGVFVGLSAWNQFVDAIFGECAIATIGEFIFLLITIAVSILTYIKWQKKQLQP